MMETKLFRRFTVIIAIAAIFLFITAGTTFEPKSPRANDIIVDTTVDEFADPGPDTGCSLREAVQTISTGIGYGGCPDPDGGEIIILPSGDYTLTRTGSEEDNNEKGDLDIIKNVEIYGQDTSGGLPTIHGSSDRIFDVGVDVIARMEDFYIVDGSNVGWGAGIYNRGDLTLDNVTLSYNTSTANGAGITSYGTSASLTIHDSVFSNNTSVGQGGGIEIQFGDFTCEDCAFLQNHANKGGGIYLHTATDTNHVTITQCLFSDNSATTDGGGIYNGGATSINRSWFDYNNAPSGGNIMNTWIDSKPILYINQTAILNGTAWNGGGIENYGYADLYISYTTISGNYTSVFGGAGIFLYNNTGNVLIDHATIADNNLASGGVGSAIAQYCDTCPVLPLEINNSILSGPVDNVCYGSVDVLSRNNIETSDTCDFQHGATQNYVNAIPHLGPLAQYPSTYTIWLPTFSTYTYSLERDSIAIDTGYCTFTSGEDQNGLHVPVDGDLNGTKVCDRGAFEVQNEVNFLAMIISP
jgi:CSLREA domain-containing protein